MDLWSMVSEAANHGDDGGGAVLTNTLNLLVAIGTLAAAVAAVWAARAAKRIAEDDRAEADRRAIEDRAAAAGRDAAERRHNNLRYDLDHLVSIAEALEMKNQLVGAADATEQKKATGVLTARLNASPVPLPAFKAATHGNSISLAQVNDIFQRYGDLVPRAASTHDLAANPRLVGWAELHGKIRDLRNELNESDGQP